MITYAQAIEDIEDDMFTTRDEFKEKWEVNDSVEDMGVKIKDKEKAGKKYKYRTEWNYHDDGGACSASEWVKDITKIKKQKDK